MSVINKLLYIEACPFEYERFPDSSTSILVTFCEHGHCGANENQLCEFEGNVWHRR